MIFVFSKHYCVVKFKNNKIKMLEDNIKRLESVRKLLAKEDYGGALFSAGIYRSMVHLDHEAREQFGALQEDISRLIGPDPNSPHYVILTDLIDELRPRLDELLVLARRHGLN